MNISVKECENLKPAEKFDSTNKTNDAEPEYYPLKAKDVKATMLTSVAWNFVLMSILFSANHGCVVACLSVATARLESTGAWSSGIFYIAFIGSSLSVATHLVRTLGSRLAMMLSMGCFSCYVACFLLETSSSALEIPAAVIGAVIGGIGGGFAWTAQGAFFSETFEIYALMSDLSLSDSASLLAGVFAFIFLTVEVLLRMLSSVLLNRSGVGWSTVFWIYTVIAFLSTINMDFVKTYEMRKIQSNIQRDTSDGNKAPHHSIMSNLTATLRIFRDDPKMKYMFGLNAIFGLSVAFINSYVNGEFVETVLNEENDEFVGYLGALSAAVSAVLSLLFGFLDNKIGKGYILILGTFSYVGVILPFLIYPNAENWGLFSLVMVYVFQGIGRATYEGTLRATFAEFFFHDKDVAFANKNLQVGISFAIGYVLPFLLRCNQPSKFCVSFSDGSLHDLLTFELLILFVAILAILGYWRASVLYEKEKIELLYRNK